MIRTQKQALRALSLGANSVAKGHRLVFEATQYFTQNGQQIPSSAGAGVAQTGGNTITDGQSTTGRRGRRGRRKTAGRAGQLSANRTPSASQSSYQQLPTL